MHASGRSLQGMQGLSAPLRREQRRGRARRRACVTFACTLLLKYGLQMGRLLHGGWAHKPGTHAVSGRAGGQICPAEINHPITICHPHPPHTHRSQTGWPASHQLPQHSSIITHSPDEVSQSTFAVDFPKRCMDFGVMEAVCIGDLGSGGFTRLFFTNIYLKKNNLGMGKKIPGNLRDFSAHLRFLENVFKSGCWHVGSGWSHSHCYGPSASYNLVQELTAFLQLFRHLFHRFLLQTLTD